MVQAKIKILLIFRSREKAGKSIEGLFDNFTLEQLSGIELKYWYYNLRQNLLMNIISLRRQRADVWHITGDINYLVLALWGKKTVLTIHDIGRYKELRSWKKWIFGWLWLKWPMQVANVVTVVSAYTRNEILNHINKRFEPKVKIVHNAVNPIYSATSKTFNSHRPRILLLGTAPHKNIETVFQAVVGLNCLVSIIGKLNEKQLFFLKQGEIVYESFQNLSDADVKQQYGLADIVVFPSLHEGFGLPVIEAQAMGCPVITSRLASLPEIAGTGAHYLDDPLDVDELRKAILTIVDHTAYRDGLIEKGYENVQRFRWPIMRDAYLGIYKSVMTS